jgi:hypothetical protein
MHPPEAHAVLDTLHPLGHRGDITDIVEAILYLEQAGFVTGEILHVDAARAPGTDCAPRRRSSALAPAHIARPNTVTQIRRRISIPCRRYNAIAPSLSENTCRNGISPRAEICRATAPSSDCA